MYCEEKGIKYLHGVEVYLTKELFVYPDIPDEWYEANSGRDLIEVQKELDEYLESNKSKVRDNYHTILIAKNEAGFREINTLLDIASQDDHTYYKHRISFEEFFNISDNVIKISACLASPLNKLDMVENASLIDKFLRTYDYYELQPHVYSEEQKE